MIKFLSSYLLLLSCLTHFFCCGIPLFLSLTSLTSILGFSTLAFFDFPWFEDFEIQFFLMTTFIFILLVFTQISNKKFNSSHDLLNDSYCKKSHLDFLEKINFKKSICSIIMDQKYFPGVGNYIKSEGLYISKIHPEEKWGNICENKLHQLIRNTKFIMKKSYDNGGAELKDFSNPFKKSTFKLKIYGRKKTETNQNIISVKTSDSTTTWICKQTQKKS